MEKHLHFCLALLLPLFWIGCDGPVANSDMIPQRLRCENKINPIGLDGAAPRLSWTVAAEGRNRWQTAYRILVADDSAALMNDQGTLWDSGKRISERTLNIDYKGEAFGRGQTCYWKVMVWDEDSLASGWSEVNSWTLGLLSEKAWQAQWIGYDAAWDDPTLPSKPYANGEKPKKRYKPLPSPYLRKEFTMDQVPESAKLYATALGFYDIYINGEQVTDAYFNPGWSDYAKRIYYQTFDVAEFLKQGNNVISAVLADGWYAGNTAIMGQYFYGKKLRLKAQLEWNTADGSSGIMTSDSSWKASYGAYRQADLLSGEVYDARLEHPREWRLPGFDDSAWQPVIASDSSTAPIEAHPALPVRKQHEIAPAGVVEIRPGVHIVNMGQNFSGFARIRIQGKRGDSITLRFAERMQADTTLYVQNLRSAECTDVYVCANAEEVIWQPRFTYHGYQYIEVHGYPGTLTRDDVTGISIHSDLEPTGTFRCSDPLLNKLAQNILWSQRSNFIEVPTDCPQRDERLGWTGDGQLFFNTAAYNMDVSAFMTKWMTDIYDGQKENGGLPSTAPVVYTRLGAGWGDAGIIIPWKHFLMYGDTQMLAENYAGMQRFINHNQMKSEGSISNRVSYGDWQHVKSNVPRLMFSSAYSKHSVDLIAQIAEVLGKTSDVNAYNKLSNTLREGFQKNFIDEDGRSVFPAQTTYLQAYQYGLVHDSLKPKMVDGLIGEIENRDRKLSTGIHGTALLLPTLTELGGEYLDLAYEIALSKEYPSWGYQIEQGANTIWERWDSYRAEIGFPTDNVNSLNHFAFGSIGEWMYGYVAGIRPELPGFKSVIIQPNPGGGLTQAEATYQSVRGEVTSSWTWIGNTFKLTVDIPANTTGVVTIPSDDPTAVLEGGISLQKAEGISMIEHGAKEVTVTLGSGHYVFQSTLKSPLGKRASKKSTSEK